MFHDTFTIHFTLSGEKQGDTLPLLGNLKERKSIEAGRQHIT